MQNVTCGATRQKALLFSGSDMYFDLQRIFLDVVLSHPTVQEYMYPAGRSYSRTINVQQNLAVENVKCKRDMVLSRDKLPKMVVEDCSLFGSLLPVCVILLVCCSDRVDHRMSTRWGLACP